MSTEAQLPMCVLHLEDSPLDHALVCRELKKFDTTIMIERVESLADFSAALQQSRFHVVLADYRLAGFTALDAWAVMQIERCKLPFILLSGAIGEAAAVAAIKLGISDYLPKDELPKLPHTILRAIEMQAMRLAKEDADLELAKSEKRLASFAEHLQSAIEQERAAISREIHDDIGGALAAIRFDLFWLKRHNAQDDAGKHIESATDMLQQAIEASQRIMMNLRPAILDQGLSAAVHWLSSGFSKRNNVPVRVDLAGDLSQLSKSIQLVAYRTVQEALTNISKHARCSRVTIDISDAEGVLTVEVSDNGQGITAQEQEKPKSFGLRGLQERAKTVGGWVDISAQAGAGTSIILSIPLPIATNPES
jgi:signal transduction histidine kinase